MRASDPKLAVFLVHLSVYPVVEIALKLEIVEIVTTRVLFFTAVRISYVLRVDMNLPTPPDHSLYVLNMTLSRMKCML
jgi:hypothetical protein